MSQPTFTNLGDLIRRTVSEGSRTPLVRSPWACRRALSEWWRRTRSLCTRPSTGLYGVTGSFWDT